MYKAVVFDMDGVLVDTEKIYRLSWKKNGMSIGIPEYEMETVCDRVAGGNKASNARVFKDIMGDDFDYPAFRQRTMDLFDEYVAEHGIDIKPDVKATLEFLKNRGIKIALATSTERSKAEQRLRAVGICDYFDEKVCGNEIAHGKPEPDIYLKACEMLGVAPEDAVAVEDSVNGVVSADRAGLYTVMVVDLVRPNETTEQHADQTYYNIRDMWSLFE